MPEKPLIPPHVNAGVHQRIMARLRSMTPEERAQTLVDAGILERQEDGTYRLTKVYREDDPNSMNFTRGPGAMREQEHGKRDDRDPQRGRRG